MTRSFIETSQTFPMLQRFSFFQFNHGSETYPLSLSWLISPGLSSRLSLLLIYYSDSPVSTCGRLLRRDHLMIDGSPEVTQGWGTKEVLGIQPTSWNQLGTSKIVFKSEERVVKEHEMACLADHRMLQRDGVPAYHQNPHHFKFTYIFKTRWFVLRGCTEYKKILVTFTW